jgi:hypothetical protein
MISASTPTLEKLRLANIALHHASPGKGLPVPSSWIIHVPNLRWLELRLTMASAGSWELGHLPQLDYASIMLNAQKPRDYGRLLTKLSSVRELEIRNFDCATFQVRASIYHHQCIKAFHRGIFFYFHKQASGPPLTNDSVN